MVAWSTQIAIGRLGTGRTNPGYRIDADQAALGGRGFPWCGPLGRWGVLLVVADGRLALPFGFFDECAKCAD